MIISNVIIVDEILKKSKYFELYYRKYIYNINTCDLFI